MYTVCVQAHYDSAHFLRNYKGKCGRVHGHRYVVEVALRADELDEAGIAYDFVDLKKLLRQLAERLDHELINEVPPFTEIETSAENQARYFYEEMKAGLPPTLAEGLVYARVWETPGQWAMYSEESVLPMPTPPHSL